MACQSKRLHVVSVPQTATSTATNWVANCIYYFLASIRFGSMSRRLGRSIDWHGMARHDMPTYTVVPYGVIWYSFYWNIAFVPCNDTTRHNYFLYDTITTCCQGACFICDHVPSINKWYATVDMMRYMRCNGGILFWIASALSGPVDSDEGNVPSLLTRYDTTYS